MKFTTHFELHSQTTRLVEGVSHGVDHRSHTGFSPSMTPRSKRLRPASHPETSSTNYNSGRSQISNLSCCRFTRRYWGNPCWFLFLRLLICLSSAGIPTWSEVNHWKMKLLAGTKRSFQSDEIYYAWSSTEPPLFFGHVMRRRSNTKLRLSDAMTLEQACPPECRGAQCAFKDSMIHWILQFTLLIAFRCVLHRCQNQEIRCWKFWLFLFQFRYHVIYEFEKASAGRDRQRNRFNKT